MRPLRPSDRRPRPNLLDQRAQRRDGVRGRPSTRGQSLVEFAIVLPILLFLTHVALDFGRVYLGWINLQSMARIAANVAANNPTAWSSGNGAVQATYQNQIRNDAAATNCRLPTVSGVTMAPDPTFADTGGNGGAADIGDSATVALSCTFELITPGIRDVLGGSITVSASSVFPVKTAMSSTGGGFAGSAPAAAFSGNSTLAPSALTGTAPFTVSFRDTSGGNPTGWVWAFNDGTPNSPLQDPLDHTFVLPGTYIVQMTASNAWGSSTESMGITVAAPSVIDFTADRWSGDAPLAVTFTDASSPGGTAYDWDFGTGEGTASGQSVSHTYATPGTYTVRLTVTYPTGAESATRTVAVSVGLCTVPPLHGVRRNDAQAAWTGAQFTGTVTDGPGTPKGNYVIERQSVTADTQVPCDSDVTVYD
jgi:PKD repeat protein